MAPSENKCKVVDESPTPSPPKKPRSSNNIIADDNEDGELTLDSSQPLEYASTTQEYGPSDNMNVVLDQEMLNELDTATRNQVTKLAMYSNAKAHTYVLDKMPEQGLDWGVRAKFADKSSILCHAGGINPAVVWVTGQVSGLWFFDKTGGPSERVAITVVPFSVDAAGIARKMLSLRSTPQLDITETSWSAIQFPRWQNTRVPGENTLASCPPVHRANLKNQDVVVIEAWVTRYRKKDGSAKPAPAEAHKWVNWVAKFKLQSVSLLHRPEHTVEDTTVEI
ncbi:hypothetical protein SERLA73DRAFT_74434 [Serpula lacrymans var. lacrymans S7.3]|uniref:Uncharacterized protein n=1 Tax=Serpula lacrymans var. lacrymans (strain S7.3) TaxID=936435 RepID=F8Q1M3_SERL3|nr:hypothetical protein SERLA73DRAFT_74434 [Serpula lacrymans var. lacrymans S7.3]